MTVAELARHVVTPEELLQIPDSNTMELVDGRILEKPVSILSSDVEGEVYDRLKDFVKRNPVAKVFPASLGYQCFDDAPGKVRRPDVTIVRVERLAKLPDSDAGYMPLVPDLAVEVISPNDLAYGVSDKVKEYQAAGFPLVWVVDPSFQAITVYLLGNRPSIFIGDDEMTLDGLLPGFRCKVADFFPSPIVRPK